MRAAALLAQGAVAHAFGDPSAARVALLDAADLFADVEARHERAQALLPLARCEAGSDRRDAASAHAVEALRIAQDLGCRSLAGEARDLLAHQLGVEGPGARTSAVAAALRHGLV